MLEKIVARLLVRLQRRLTSAQRKERSMIVTIICMNAVEGDLGSARALIRYIVTTTDLCRQHRQDTRVEAAVSRESRDLVAPDPTVEATTDKREIENLIDDSGPIHGAGEGERNELVQVVAAAAEV
jgi:hypothetical protein